MNDGPDGGLEADCVTQGRRGIKDKKKGYTPKRGRELLQKSTPVSVECLTFEKMMGKHSKGAKPHTAVAIKFSSRDWESRLYLQKSSLKALVKETGFLPLGKAHIPYEPQTLLQVFHEVVTLLTDVLAVEEPRSDTMCDLESRSQVPF